MPGTPHVHKVLILSAVRDRNHMQKLHWLQLILNLRPLARKATPYP